MQALSTQAPFAPINRLLALLRRDNEMQYDVEDALPPDTIYVATIDNLPVDGEADKKYHVVADVSEWRWADGAYHEINPYVFGVDQKYRDVRIVRPKATIVDPSAEMASLSLEQVRGGASETLATLYNLIALRADLDMLERIVVNGHKMTVMGLLSKGRHVRSEDNITEWFQREHKAMHTLLSACARKVDGKVKFHDPVVDALFKQKAILAWDNTVDRAVLKLENFEVYL